MTLSKDGLLQFMENKLGVDTSLVDADTPLFSSGIIDSTGMVELIVFVESTSAVKFSPDDITLDNLDSIRRILNFVADGHAQ
jgi:acyl carrier protein